MTSNVLIKGYIPKLSEDIKVKFENDEVSHYLTEEILENLSRKIGFLKSTLRKYSVRKSYPIFFLKEMNEIILDDIFEIIENSEIKFFSKWKLPYLSF